MTDKATAQDWMTRYQETLRLRAALQPSADAHNKRELIAALAGIGIARVEVAFDGYGDSGQVEAPIYVSPSGETIEPGQTDPIAIQSVRHDGSGIDTNLLAVPEAIERICYDLLEAHRPGWENNDGAFGDFVFDIAGDAIAYTHNSRWTQVDTDLFEL